jgi:hypothetical protein
MVDLGATCIEADEDTDSGVTPFFAANNVCGQRGRRLCTYAEWLRACRDFSAQMMRMTDNFELVDIVYADADGGLRYLVVGNGSCDAARAQTSDIAFFRCCL